MILQTGGELQRLPPIVTFVGHCAAQIAYLSKQAGPPGPACSEFVEAFSR
jgi:hypothetical protein